MDKIKNFFTTTVPGWWRNHPIKLLAGGVGSIVVLSSAASVFSPKTSDAKPDKNQSTTSITQTAETTDTTTLSETTATLTTKISTETTPVETTTSSEKLDKDDLFMSDYLKKYIEKVTFEDELKPYVIDSDSLLSGEGFFVDENGNITNSQGYTYTPEGTYIDESSVSYDGDFYLAPDGLLYTSREEYEKVVNSTSDNSNTITGEYDENGLYVAPDGSRWNSKQDYEDSLVHVEGEDYVTPSEPDSIVEGNYFVDPDGIFWNSEQEYLDFINPSYSDDNKYVAPDGSIWESEDEYLKSLEGDVVYPEPGETDEPVIDQEPPVEEPTIEDDGFYHAPDGSVWTTEEEYLEFVQSFEEAQKPDTPETTTTAPVVEEPTTTTTTVDEIGEGSLNENGYYEAPDGSIWTSEEEYKNYIDSYNEMYNTETTTQATTTQETTTTTVVEETVTTTTSEKEVATTTTQATTTQAPATTQQQTQTQPAVTEPTVTEPAVDESSGYYEAPDGSFWASYEDYMEFMDSLGVEDVIDAGYQKLY